MTYHSLSEIQENISQGKISCKQLVKHYLSNIQTNKHLNAFLEVFEKEALEKAELFDKKIADKKPLGKLFGAVIAIKDVFCYKNHKVSASSKILENFISLHTSTAVQRLIDEDVIIIGRTNCDEFAMGTSNENSAFGNVLNAIDNTKVPGGSSGGSAVAVQADMCLASLGTDTGGSIRQPASFCDVVGFKPTYGRISRYGIIAYASSFDQVGTFTKNIEDAALLLEVMAGKDEMDATCSSKEVPKYSQHLSPNGKMKIAFLKDALEHPALDKEIKNHSEKIISELKNAGHKVEGVNFPFLNFLVPSYYVLTTAEASSNLARYDGVHYGYKSPNATDMESTHKKSRTEGFGKEVKRRIMLGTFVLSSGYYDAYYAKAQKIRRMISDKTKEILSEYDFILLPATPTLPFGIGEKSKAPLLLYLADIFTVQANLAGTPAISLPLGKNSENLPFGIQLIANKFEEKKLFAFSNEMMKFRGAGKI